MRWRNTPICRSWQLQWTQTAPRQERRSWRGRKSRLTTTTRRRRLLRRKGPTSPRGLFLWMPARLEPRRKFPPVTQLNLWCLARGRTPTPLSSNRRNMPSEHPLRRRASQQTKAPRRKTHTFLSWPPLSMPSDPKLAPWPTKLEEEAVVQVNL